MKSTILTLNFSNEKTGEPTRTITTVSQGVNPGICNPGRAFSLARIRQLTS
jgi:hypothetical protein